MNENAWDFSPDEQRSPIAVTVSGNLAAYLRAIAFDKGEDRGVGKIALDSIVESVVHRAKEDFEFASLEQAEAWLFDTC